MYIRGQTSKPNSNNSGLSQSQKSSNSAWMRSNSRTTFYNCFHPQKSRSISFLRRSLWERSMSTWLRSILKRSNSLNHRSPPQSPCPKPSTPKRATLWSHLTPSYHYRLTTSRYSRCSSNSTTSCTSWRLRRDRLPSQTSRVASNALSVASSHNSTSSSFFSWSLGFSCTDGSQGKAERPTSWSLTYLATSSKSSRTRMLQPLRKSLRDSLSLTCSGRERQWSSSSFLPWSL